MIKQSGNLNNAVLLRQKAEEHLSQRKRQTNKTVSEADMLKLIHELEVHQIELEMQNDELLLANHRANEATQKYEELYDFAPAGYFTLSRQGKIVEMNLRCTLMLGRERSKLINSRFDSFIKDESRGVFVTFLEELFQDKKVAICDVSLSCNDGNCLHVHLTGITSVNEEHCRITVIDITDRKKAEDDLRKNLAKFKVLIDTFPIGITISDPAGNIVETNEKALELLGLTRDEHLKRMIKGKEWKIIRTDGTIFPPDEYPSVRALQENRIVENVEMGLIKSGEEVTWINVTAAPIPIEEYGVLIAYNDITRRRRLESNLLENEERLRLALKATNDVVWDWDIINDSQHWNEAGRKVFGWTEIVENTVNAAWWLERIHPDDRQRVEYRFYAVVQNTTDIRWQDEYRFKRSDGTYAEVLDRGYVMRDNAGKAIRMIGAMLDITERKKAEQDLSDAKEKIEESERLFKSLINNAPDGVVIIDEGGKFKYASPNAARLFGYDENEVLGHSGDEFTHPDDLPLIYKTFEAIINNPAQRLKAEYRFKRGNGDYRWIETTFSNLLADNAINGFILNFTDVTERKQILEDIVIAKEKAEESEARFRKLMEGIDTVAVQGYGPDGITRFWNKASEKLYGYTQQEAIGRNLLDLIIPDEMKDEVTKAIHKMTETGEPIPSGELMLKHKEGTLVPVISHHAVVRVPGLAPELFCLDIDITERKKAEEALLEKIKDLELFSKLTVGREVTMVELKNEVNILLNRLGEENKYNIV